MREQTPEKRIRELQELINEYSPVQAGLLEEIQTVEGKLNANLEAARQFDKRGAVSKLMSKDLKRQMRNNKEAIVWLNARLEELNSYEQDIRLRIARCHGEIQQLNDELGVASATSSDARPERQTHRRSDSLSKRLTRVLEDFESEHPERMEAITETAQKLARSNEYRFSDEEIAFGTLVVHGAEENKFGTMADFGTVGYGTTNFGSMAVRDADIAEPDWARVAATDAEPEGIEGKIVPAKREEKRGQMTLEEITALLHQHATEISDDSGSEAEHESEEEVSQEQEQQEQPEELTLGRETYLSLMDALGGDTGVRASIYIAPASEEERTTTETQAIGALKEQISLLKDNVKFKVHRSRQENVVQLLNTLLFKLDSVNSLDSLQQTLDQWAGEKVEQRSLKKFGRKAEKTVGEYFSENTKSAELLEKVYTTAGCQKPASFGVTLTGSSDEYSPPRSEGDHSPR